LGPSRGGGERIDAIIPDSVADEYNNVADTYECIRAGDFLAAVNDEDDIEQGLQANAVDLVVRRRNPPLLGGAPFFEVCVERDPGEPWGLGVHPVTGSIAGIAPGAIERYNQDGQGPEVCVGDLLVAMDGLPFDQARLASVDSGTLLVACSPQDVDRPSTGGRSVMSSRGTGRPAPSSGHRVGFEAEAVP